MGKARCRLIWNRRKVIHDCLRQNSPLAPDATCRSGRRWCRCNAAQDVVRKEDVCKKRKIGLTFLIAQPSVAVGPLVLWDRANFYFVHTNESLNSLELLNLFYFFF